MFKLFFISRLTTPRPTLGHWQEGTLTYSMLITTLFKVQPESHREPRNEVGSQSLGESISRIRARNLPNLNVTCYPTVSFSPKLKLETIGNCLAGVLSRNYRSFSLILNSFHILRQCFYSNFKQVNIGWEVLRWLFVKLIQWFQHTCITIHLFK